MFNVAYTMILDALLNLCAALPQLGFFALLLRQLLVTATRHGKLGSDYQ